MSDVVVFKEKEMVLDLETASTPSNQPGKRDLVAILSVGAVVFDAAATNTFEDLIERTADVRASEQYISANVLYTPVSFMHSISHGFNCDPSTLEFWKDQVQYKGSYNMVEAASAFVEDIKFTFAKIDQFLKKHRDVKRVWMRDQSFDGTILREAFNHLGFVLPINPFIYRDHRVLTDKGLFGVEFPPKHEAQMAHHALHDAAQEAMMRQTLYARLNPPPAEPEPQVETPKDADKSEGETNDDQGAPAAKIVATKGKKAVGMKAVKPPKKR